LSVKKKNFLFYLEKKRKRFYNKLGKTDLRFIRKRKRILYRKKYKPIPYRVAMSFFDYRQRRLEFFKNSFIKAKNAKNDRYTALVLFKKPGFFARYNRASKAKVSRIYFKKMGKTIGI
jgi:hypothetical protein